MAKPHRARILYIEDDPGAARLFQKRMSGDLYEVDLAYDGEEGLRMWESGSYDVLAVDQDMPKKKGLDVIRELARRGPLPPTVMITGHGNQSVAVEAMKLGADDYIIKDLDGLYLELIPSVIARALEKRRMFEDKIRSEVQLEESRRRLSRSQEIAHVGSWELDLPANRLIWSDEVYRIFGLDPEEFTPSYEGFLEAVHPDDRAAVDTAYSKSLRQGEGYYEIEHRIVRRGSGEIRYVHEKCEHVRDHAGNIVRSVGMVQDITHRWKVERELIAKRDLFSIIFDNAPYVSMLANRQGRIENINRKGISLAGRPKESLLGLLGGQVFRCLNSFGTPGCGRSPECTDCPVRTKVSRAFETGEPILEEDGRLTVLNDRSEEVELHFLVSVTIVTVEDAELALVTLIDITDRKKAEEARRVSEEIFRLVFESSPDAIAITRAVDGKFLNVNKRFSDMSGFGRDEALSGTSLDLGLWVDPEDRRKIGEALRLHGYVENYEAEFRRKDGTVFAGLISAVRLTLDGEPCVLSFTRNIEEMKRAARALHESEEKYRLLVDRAPIGIISVDTHGVITEINQKLLEIFGSPSVEASKSINMFTFPLLAQAGVSDIFRNCIDECKPLRAELSYTSMWGKASYLRFLVTPMQDPNGNVIGCQATVEDVTERKMVEDEVRNSLSLLTSTLDSTADGILVIGTDGKISAFNKRFQEMWNIPDELLETRDDETTLRFSLDQLKKPEPFLERVRELYSQPEAESFEMIEFKDGRICERQSRPQKIGDRIVGRVWSFRDVTQQKTLEKQLVQAQKMESIGTLAGGIAHDFNNLLQVVLGYSDMLLFNKKPKDPAYDELRAIRQAARDGSDLANRILAFSRRLEPNARPVNLNSEIKRVQKMLKRTVAKMIQIELVLADDLKAANVDPGQMEQILLNLAVNAQHAMPNGGRLTIETANATLDEYYCKTHLGVEPGDYILLTVSDTGHGMEKEVVEHIFEPFYTTKGPGEGTGLGLAMAFGIIKNHGGNITCYTEPGVGTAFKIYLPAIVHESEPDVAATRQMPAFGTETILIVDDEKRIRDVGAKTLTMAGYAVLTAPNGKEAIEVYRSHRGTIALVILDLIMPEMGGKQCLEGLLNIDPKVKVVIASGYSPNGPTKDAVEAGAKGFIGKPYEAKEILTLVRRLLDES